ncbi:MAG: ABC transporter permease [Chloroflexi bacterium]|nr:ABC transporter permease [Chloroflexota bacterium]
MNRFIGKRLLQLPFSVLGITLIVFVLIRMTGDPVVLYLPPDATQEARAQLTRQLGLDQPLPVQYGVFILNLLHGDLGQSLYYKKPALDVVVSYIPATLQLMGTALIVAALLGMVLGLTCAFWKGSLFDTFFVTLSVFGQAMPSFWLGIMLILFFAVNLHWLPASGRGTWANMVLPTITLLMYLLPSTLLLVRSSAIEILAEDFLTVARAKGLSQRAILLRHVLKNALNPTISSLGLQMGSLMGGAIVTETVFAWPGLGRLSVEAVLSRDFSVVQAAVVVLATWVVLSNLLADVANSIIDPRLQAG